MTEVVKTITDTPEQKVWLVKLNRPRVSRKFGEGNGGGIVDVDHALIGVSVVDREDKYGTLHYEETTVVGSDEHGTQYPVYLYITQRALSLEETLFTIGETYADATKG